MSIRLGDIDVASEIVELNFQLHRTQLFLDMLVVKITAMQISLKGLTGDTVRPSPFSVLTEDEVAELEKRSLDWLQKKFPNMGIQRKPEGQQAIRRFVVGDKVRLRAESNLRFSYDVRNDEVGTVIGVEPHPPQTGPTYRVEVEFPRARLPYVFAFEYELANAPPQG